MAEEASSRRPTTRQRAHDKQQEQRRNKYNQNKREKRSAESTHIPSTRVDRTLKRDKVKAQGGKKAREEAKKKEKKALQKKKRAKQQKVKQRTVPRKLYCVYCRDPLEGTEYAPVPGYHSNLTRTDASGVSGAQHNTHRRLILRQCAQQWKKDRRPPRWTPQATVNFSPLDLLEKSATNKGTCFMHTHHFNPAHIDKRKPGSGHSTHCIKYVYNSEVRGIVSLPTIVDGKVTGQNVSPLKRENARIRAARRMQAQQGDKRNITVEFLAQDRADRLETEATATAAGMRARLAMPAPAPPPRETKTRY